MNEPRDDRLTTAELAAAAAAPAATRERDYSRDVELRPASVRDAQTSTRDEYTALFDGDAAGDLRHRWEEIQSGFVDEPRHAVERADELVADVMKRLAQSFADERSALEAQWTRGDDVSTEDLRIALQRYRSFFDRLLSI